MCVLLAALAFATAAPERLSRQIDIIGMQYIPYYYIILSSYYDIICISHRRQHRQLQQRRIRRLWWLRYVNEFKFADFLLII